MPEKMDKSKLRKPSRRMTQIRADNVRAFRRAKRLFQEELADMCNLHRTYVGSVEGNVTLSTLEVIAAALGVSVPKLLTERGIENDNEK